MEKDNVVKVAVEKDGVKKTVAGPEEESVTAPEVKRTVGVDAAYLNSVKDRLKKLKNACCESHWNKISSSFRAAREKASMGSEIHKLTIEPEEVKDETPEATEAAKTAPGAVESH